MYECSFPCRQLAHSYRNYHNVWAQSFNLSHHFPLAADDDDESDSSSSAAGATNRLSRTD
jgi:hypothetical protein